MWNGVQREAVKNGGEKERFRLEWRSCRLKNATVDRKGDGVRREIVYDEEEREN